MNSHSKLNTLLTLAQTEEAEFADFEQMAGYLNQAWIEGSNDSKDYEDKEASFIAKIQALPQTKALKFAEKGDEFKAFCERHSLWTNFLTERGYHGASLPTLEEEVPDCSSLNQYVGHFLFNQWEESKDDLELLNKACEQKIFPALKARAHLNLITLKNNIENMSPAEVNAAEGRIVKDLATINTHYWAPGHIYSYTAFMELAIIHHTDEAGEEAAADKHREMDYLKCALECELTAQILFNHPVSTAIFNEHGINEWLQNAVSSLPQAEQKLLTILAISKSDKLYQDTVDKVSERYKEFKM